MALLNTFRTSESIELADFVDYAERHVDMKDTDSLFSLGEQLSMLGNNRKFLSAFMSDYIKQRVIFDPLSAVVSQSVVLARRDAFYVRANFWLPAEEMNAAETMLFAYDQAHDHNFDLLSFAYCGPGYKTDLYSYDYDSVAGYVGEQVALEPLGTHAHRCGETILYICSRDVHTQYPPAQASITLNVLPLHTQHGLIDQYFFDVDRQDLSRSRLAKHAYTPIEARRQVFDIVKHVANDDLVDLLCEFAAHHACRRTRFHALEALEYASPAAHQLMREKLQADPTPLIRHHLDAPR